MLEPEDRSEGWGGLQRRRGRLFGEVVGSEALSHWGGLSLDRSKCQEAFVWGVARYRYIPSRPTDNFVSWAP